MARSITCAYNNKARHGGPGGPRQFSKRGRDSSSFSPSREFGAKTQAYSPPGRADFATRRAAFTAENAAALARSSTALRPGGVGLIPSFRR